MSELEILRHALEDFAIVASENNRERVAAAFQAYVEATLPPAARRGAVAFRSWAENAEDIDGDWDVFHDFFDVSSDAGAIDMANYCTFVRMAEDADVTDYRGPLEVLEKNASFSDVLKQLADYQEEHGEESLLHAMELLGQLMSEP